MKQHHSDAINIQPLTAKEIEQVAGAGVRFGTLGVGEDGRYEIVGTAGLAPLYVKFGGKWVPLGTEPFIGPAASELGI